jgi:hypothetical protein
MGNYVFNTLTELCDSGQGIWRYILDDNYNIKIYKDDKLYADNDVYRSQSSLIINKIEVAKLFILEITSIVINECGMEDALEFYNMVNHLMNNLK